MEANGNNFIMRGVSHAHAYVWYPSQTSSFASIAVLGANWTITWTFSGGQTVTQA